MWQTTETYSPQTFSVTAAVVAPAVAICLNSLIAVLKQLFRKDKGIGFSWKAKKSKLVQIFNTQAGCVTAYDGCFPKPKQFYFADNHPQKKIDNYVVDSYQRIC